MNKSITLSLAAVAVSLAASAQSYFEVNGILYREITKDPSKMQVRVLTKNEDGEPGQGMSFYEGDVVIPATVEHDLDIFEVTSIQAGAFNSCAGLTSLTIGKNITELPNYTITNCPQLREVKFEGELKTIGQYSFSTMPSLTTLDLGDTLTDLNGSIYNAPALKKLRLPKGIKKIEAPALSLLPSLEEINLENVETFYSTLSGTQLRNLDLSSAREINMSFSAMQITHKFESIKFGKPLKTIEMSFNGAILNHLDLSATSLETIRSSFMTSNIGTISLPPSLQLVDQSFFNDATTPIHYIKFTSKNLVIKSSFYNYDGEKLDLPEGITEIYSSFTSTPNLTELIFPNSLTKVETSFSDVPALKKIVFGKNMEVYPSMYKSGSLEEIVFNNPDPEGAMSIISSLSGGGFGNSYNNLRIIQLPAGLRNLKSTMSNLGNLEKINLENIETFEYVLEGNGLTSIDLSSATEVLSSFSKMRHKADVTFGKNLKKFHYSFNNIFTPQVDLSQTVVDTISSSFTDCRIGTVILPKTTRFVKFSFNGSKDIEGSGVEKVILRGDNAVLNGSFKNFNGTELIIEEGIARLDVCFTDCPELKELVLPESLVSINTSFGNMPKLEKLVFGSKIEKYPYIKVPSLKDVHFKAPEPIGTCPTFLRIDGELTIHIPAGSLEAYEAAWHLKRLSTSTRTVNIVEDTYKR
ncbi:MAG: leucine-rich repeat domain-containing protein [Lachnoclostridium sp.]|nr:leucine-rich repeat domain-containing protein [Lachnoclostridium sp.]